MANANRVGASVPQSFGNFLIASGIANTAAQSNVAGVLPILSGGLTNGGAVANSGAVIIRRVTFCNPSGNISNANVSVLTSSDGNSSNAVVSNFKLTTLNATNKWQDGNIATAYLTTEVTGDQTSAFWVVVATAGATTGNVQVNVYGDVIVP
jgi:hypothetical protein